MTFPAYRVIIAHPPYQDWGEQRTMNIPVWRCVDLTQCLLVIETELARLHLAYKTMTSWGFAYRSANVRGQSLTLIGVIGDPPVPPTVGTSKHKMKLLSDREPRLLLNPPGGINRSNEKGWDVWSPFGWNQVDLFAFPVRRSHVAVEETVLDAAEDFRALYRSGWEWRFKMGDAINRLIESQSLPAMEAYLWAREATGNRVSVPQLSAMARLAAEVPPSKRDPSITWTQYYNMKIRVKQRGR